MIKKYFLPSALTVMLSILLSVTAVAQRGQWQERQQQMEARRIAFITKELSLTPDEAKVFWPIYNEYHEKRNAMMLSHRSQRVDMQNLDVLTDEQLRRIADADIRNAEEMTALRRQYHEKFKQILPIRKVVELYQAERDFNRMLFQEDRQRQRGGGRSRN